MSKVYDQEYFDRWYRSRGKIHGRNEVRRKVMMAVTVAEYFMRRPVETVLDLGAGEGAWFTHLRSIRRRAEYTGVEPSAYAVERFGKERNIRQATFGEARKLRLAGEFDLVVCSDVLHYLSEREIRQGLPELVKRTGGVAYIEVLTEEDEIVGDLHGLMKRPAAWYRRLFTKAGLTQVGPYCWLSPSLERYASDLETVR